jgi:hypothetical protein
MSFNKVKKTKDNEADDEIKNDIQRSSYHL